MYRTLDSLGRLACRPQPTVGEEIMLVKKLHEAGVRSEHAYLAGLLSVGASFAAWGVSLKGESQQLDRADRWGIFVGEWAPPSSASDWRLRTTRSSPPEPADGGPAPMSEVPGD